MSAKFVPRLLRVARVPLCCLAFGLGLFSISKLPVVHAQAPKIQPGGGAAKNAKAAPLTEEQKKIRKAVIAGVMYLKATQNPKGYWNDPRVGYAALPALALLEVGVVPADPAAQRAAMHVRSSAPTLSSTYDLGLAILFLDKLGDRRDSQMIRALAMRLIAGQSTNGGWHYSCPMLDYQEEQTLYAFLKKNQPRPDPIRTAHPYLVPLPKELENVIDPLTRREREFASNPLPLDGPLFDPKFNPISPGNAKDPDPLAKDPKDKKLDLFEPFLDPTKKDDPKKEDKKPGLIPDDDDPPKTTTPPKDTPTKPTPPKIRPKGSPPLDPVKEPVTSEKPGAGEKPGTGEKSEPQPIDIRKWASVPDFYQQAESMHVYGKGKGKGKGPPQARDRDDNSNTQFAILGIWAARRHGVPVTLTLNRLDQRFRESQSPDGGWNYAFSKGGGGSTGPMTCVGLLGLGIAHGAFHEAVHGKKDTKPAMALDPAIQKGLACLSQSVGKGLPSMYMMWSLERVGVMYQLPTLRKVDWHAWGSELLLPRQQPDGSWSIGGFPGSTPTLDTSMALLFLGRVNLSRDLSSNLRQNIVVLDPATEEK